MKVHLEGMGVYGSLLAHMLDLSGVDFTWHDNDLERVAWPACTGAIYPANSEKFGPDDWCHKQWREAHKLGIYGEAVEASNFVFNHKTKPPHEGKYPVTKFGSGLKMAEPPSFHLNAQLLVPQTREKYADCMRPDHQPAQTDEYIVSHSWGERLSHVYWGWTRLVKLDFPDEMRRHGMRPCFYFREGRYIMTYAYPVPNTPWWYAGSSIIKQKIEKKKSLEIEPKYDRWKDHFERLSLGQVKVTEAGEMREGWRPASAKNNDTWVDRDLHGTIRMRPLWNSGVRHFPKQWKEIAGLLSLPFAV